MVPDHTYEPDQREMAEIAVLTVGDPIGHANYGLERCDRP